MSDPLDSFLDQYPDTPTVDKPCRRCKGTGVLGGFPGTYTSDDFASGEVDFDEYMAHERPCEDCGGTGSIRVIDEVRLSDSLNKEWRAWFQDYADMEAEYQQERRMGA